MHRGRQFDTKWLVVWLVSNSCCLNDKYLIHTDTKWVQIRDTAATMSYGISLRLGQAKCGAAKTKPHGMTNNVALLALCPLCIFQINFWTLQLWSIWCRQVIAEGGVRHQRTLLSIQNDRNRALWTTTVGFYHWQIYHASGFSGWRSDQGKTYLFSSWSIQRYQASTIALSYFSLSGTGIWRFQNPYHWLRLSSAHYLWSENTGHK